MKENKTLNILLADDDQDDRFFFQKALDTLEFPSYLKTVSDGERLLLGRQSTWPARRYSVIAGFVEPGESLEQTVAREVMEETGVHVRSCRYLASQPWPFPGALMLGFIAQADASELRVGDELEDARWFSVDDVRAAQARDTLPHPGSPMPAAAAADDGGPLLSAPISISRWLIEQWLAAVAGSPSR